MNEKFIQSSGYLTDALFSVCLRFRIGTIGLGDWFGQRLNPQPGCAAPIDLEHLHDMAVDFDPVPRLGQFAQSGHHEAARGLVRPVR
jgi:hypothetical protein